MEENLTAEQESLQLLRDIAQSQKKQEKYARWQYLVSVASACACVLIALVLLVGGIYVKNQAQGVVDKVNGTLMEADEAVNNFNQVAQDILSLDLQNLTRGVTNLTEEASEGISQAMESLQGTMTEAQEAMENVKGLNIDKLNEGIQKLNDVLEPLAKFFRISR